MSNTIKYSTQTENNTLKKGDFVIGVNNVDYGPTNETGYHNTITPPSGGYVVYKNRGDNQRSIYVAESDEELVLLKDDFGATGTTSNDVLVWAAQQDDVIILNNPLDNIVTDGLVLYLDAGFTCSYPKSNTTWYDISGNNYNGTLTNGPTFSDGSLVLDGTNDYIQIPHNSFLSSNVFGDTNYFTLSCWTKFTSFQNWTCMINKANGGYYSHTTSGLWCDVNGRVSSVIGTNQSGNPSGGVINVGYNVQLNTWYNVVGIADGTHLRLYINGDLKGSTSLSNLTLTRTENTAPITIGRRCVGCNPSHNGDISCVSIYDTALSVTEVLQNYNSQKSRFGL